MPEPITGVSKTNCTNTTGYVRSRHFEALSGLDVHLCSISKRLLARLSHMGTWLKPVLEHTKPIRATLLGHLLLGEAFLPATRSLFHYNRYRDHSSYARIS